MDARDVEMAAVTSLFRSVASDWRLSSLEIEVLLGLDLEGRTWGDGHPLAEQAETRLRLVCELDRHLRVALDGRTIAEWLRSDGLETDPLTFMSLGVEQIRAMLAAARCRIARFHPEASI